MQTKDQLTSICSQELPDSALPLNARDSKQLDLPKSTPMHQPSLDSDSLEFQTTETCKMFPSLIPMSLPAAIPASETLTHGETEKELRVQRFMACGSLLPIALALSCERIQAGSDLTRPGLGGDSEASLKNLAMQFCQSDSEPVVLGLTTNGKGCSCSPNYRTPTARDYKGMSAKSWRERTNGDKTPTLPDQLGGTPNPEFVEWLMGFPKGFTESQHWGTRSCRKSHSCSVKQSTKSKENKPS